MRNYLKSIADVKPDPRQLAWFEMGSYAFIHFGINTFTDREWGTGNEEEALFAPDQLDCDQWVEAIKAAGLKGMILTAKHHDGFCLWPSAYTKHSVKNSSYHGDVVREAADACKRGGIRFGFYLSPWDRNSQFYGTDAYNDYFCNQLTELLTGYGDIFCVWFDNACGEGPEGKKQIYDFPRYIELIRKYQPDAVIFNDFGPDVRWCGNEAGHARHSEWAVVPSELCTYSRVQSSPGPLSEEGELSFLYNTVQELGTLPTILYSKGLTFTPAEINMSIRPGWFWHEEEEPHSLERLFQTWLSSYGGNACLNLNIPPDRHGRIDEKDVNRLKEFGELINREFGRKICCEAVRTAGNSVTQPQYTVFLEDGKSAVKYIVLKEDISKGQRVESFRILAASRGGEQYPLYEGTCIGNRKICLIRDPFSAQNPLINLHSENRLQELTVQITASRGEVLLKEISVYE